MVLRIACQGPFFDEDIIINNIVRWEGNRGLFELGIVDV
jgi:hypothetical protein